MDGNQRIYISDRRDSTGYRLTKMWLTQPLPGLSAVYSTGLPDRLTEQAGRGWVSHIFVRQFSVLSLLSLIYCTVQYSVYALDDNHYNSLVVYSFDGKKYFVYQIPVR